MLFTHSLARNLDQDFYRLFRTANTAPATPHWQPACDIEEAKDHYLLTLDVPGISKEQLKIEVQENRLTISGERTFDRKKEELNYWYTERNEGRFERSFTLPTGIAQEKVEANYRDGVLRVYVPKPEAAKPRSIEITNGDATGLWDRLIGQGQKH